MMIFLLLYWRNKETLFDYPAPKKNYSVSFLVPAYNEQRSILKTLNALVNIDYPAGKKEIIVINDGSIDNTAKIVRQFMKNHHEVRLLDKINSGKANSLNEAIKIARGELLAVVDADSYPKEDSLKKMVGYFDEAKVAAVTSRVLTLGGKSFIERFQAFDYVVIAWSRKILDFIGCVYVTNGPLSVYRTKLVRKVGGFDPKNLTEDIEITWHLLSKGYETRMSYSAEVFTVVPSKIGQWIKQRIRWNLGGMQTIGKYRNFFFRGKNLFGYFVISYVTLSFFLAFVGLLLFLRWFWLKASLSLFSLPQIFKGYNPFMFMEFNLALTLTFLLGMGFFVFAIIYYKAAIKHSDLKSKGILTLLIYLFIYRSLYTIPYIMALYKLIKGDIRWYTK